MAASVRDAHEIHQARLEAWLKPPTKPWLEKTCRTVLRDMSLYGICVIDGFLGKMRGGTILNEVKTLYTNSEMFSKGQVVNPTFAKNSSIPVRGDHIVWVTGDENFCWQINYLIQTIDTIIEKCKYLEINEDYGNVLSKHHIQSRTKAMIACYPDNGAHYVKHVDNPNGDGRCITSIYYLNQNWLPEHGGLLKMYPVGQSDKVATIQPLFDRLIFFWSDRRNPHEVLASHSIRFAITLWYHDKEERERALQENYINMDKPCPKEVRLKPFSALVP